MYRPTAMKESSFHPVDALVEDDFTGKRYTQNGILNMLDRNRRIKSRPEKFQHCKEEFDVVITVEERVYDQTLEDFNNREQVSQTPVHVINIEIQDNHDEATLGAFLIYELCQLLEKSNDLEDDLDDLLHEFEPRAERDILHSVCFY